MIVEQAEIILTREELYDRVWSKSTEKVAAELGLSDVGLAKVCKKHKVPKPTRGYWAKVSHGKPVVQRPLRPIDDASLNTIRFTPRAKIAKASEPEPSARDPEIVAKIEAELRPENRIELLSDFRGADPFVRATREGLVGQTPDDYGRITAGCRATAIAFEVGVTKANLRRALLILHTLVNAFKSRGYELEADRDRPYFTVMGRQFTLSLWETSKRTKRKLTAEDKKDIREGFRWLIKEYEFVPSGILEVQLNRGWNGCDVKICDTPKQPLETRLNEALVRMLKFIDGERMRDEERE